MNIEERKENYAKARDFVAAAYLVLQQQNEPTNKAMMGQLMQYLRMHQHRHGNTIAMSQVLLRKRAVAHAHLTQEMLESYENAMALSGVERVEEEVVVAPTPPEEVVTDQIPPVTVVASTPPATPATRKKKGCCN